MRYKTCGTAKCFMHKMQITSVLNGFKYNNDRSCLISIFFCEETNLDYSQNTRSVPLPLLWSVAIYCTLLYFSILDTD